MRSKVGAGLPAMVIGICKNCERACPALGGEADSNQATWSYLELGDVFTGAASPPSAGQARSLQGAHVPLKDVQIPIRLPQQSRSRFVHHSLSLP